MGVTYNIIKKIGVIRTMPNGNNKEVNLVSWNNGVPKIDIRDWAPDHERMSKGITLHEEDARKVVEILVEYFKEAE